MCVLQASQGLFDLRSEANAFIAEVPTTRHALALSQLVAHARVFVSSSSAEHPRYVPLVLRQHMSVRCLAPCHRVVLPIGASRAATQYTHTRAHIHWNARVCVMYGVLVGRASSPPIACCTPASTTTSIPIHAIATLHRQVVVVAVACKVQQ